MELTLLLLYCVSLQDGLVKSNMDKLMWYAMNSPDKLDRIGEYLAYRLYRDINRRKTGETSSVTGENRSLTGENFSLTGVNISLTGENRSLTSGAFLFFFQT